MKVIVNIPHNIIRTIQSAGYTNEKDIKKIFSLYLSLITDDYYGQFQTDFENWFDEEGALDTLELEDNTEIPPINEKNQRMMELAGIKT